MGRTANTSAIGTDGSDNMGVVLYRLGQLESVTTKQNDAILAKLESITANYMPRVEIIERDTAIQEDLNLARATAHEEHLALMSQIKDLQLRWEKNVAGITFSNMLVNRWVQVLIIAIIAAAAYAAAASHLH